MTLQQRRMTWRVAWPLFVWLLAGAVLTYLVEPAKCCPEDEDLGRIVKVAYSLVMVVSCLVVSLLVARRYRRLVAAPVTKTIKACLYFLLALGVLCVCSGLAGVAISLAAYWKVGY